MKVINVAPHELVVSNELARSRTSKVFEERLQASIQEMGLAEPLKVAALPSGKYLIVDGMLRWRAIQTIRSSDRTAFPSIPAYVVEHERRFELRFQTDIYQDLLPSQLASLVEHLHEVAQIKKSNIARYIGVSPATLRNYTGLWRLTEKGGYFGRIVDLMDVGIIPASNPFTWLRLTDEGIEEALRLNFSDREKIDEWMEDRVSRARRGDIAPYSLKFVEMATGSLPARMYRESEGIRAKKRNLGLLRASAARTKLPTRAVKEAVDNLSKVSKQSPDRVLRTAARALCAFLQC